jgi:hypothetical protein
MTKLFYGNTKSGHCSSDSSHFSSVIFLSSAEFQAYMNFKQMESSRLTESMAADKKYSPISFLNSLNCPQHIKNDIKVAQLLFDEFCRSANNIFSGNRRRMRNSGFDDGKSSSY